MMVHRSGLPNVHVWLWGEEARARHGLLPSSKSDHSVVSESEFLAYVKEHPILLRALHVAGLRLHVTLSYLLPASVVLYLPG